MLNNLQNDMNNSSNIESEVQKIYKERANLYNQLKPRLIKEKTSYIYEKIDKPLINVLSLMEEKGIKADSKYLRELSEEFFKESNKIEKSIFKITGKEFVIIL